MGRDGFGKDLSSLLLFSVVDLALDSLSTRFTSHDDLRGRWQMCTWSVLSNSPDNLRQRSLTISLTKIRVEVRKIFEKRYIWQIFSNQPISIWHHVNFLCKSMILAEKDLYFYEENMNNGPEQTTTLVHHKTSLFNKLVQDQYSSILYRIKKNYFLHNET